MRLNLFVSVSHFLIRSFVCISIREMQWLFFSLLIRSLRQTEFCKWMRVISSLNAFGIVFKLEKGFVRTIWTHHKPLSQLAFPYNSFYPFVYFDINLSTFIELPYFLPWYLINTSQYDYPCKLFHLWLTLISDLLISFQLPTQLFLWDSLPRNAMGKVNYSCLCFPFRLEKIISFPFSIVRDLWECKDYFIRKHLWPLSGEQERVEKSTGCGAITHLVLNQKWGIQRTIFQIYKHHVFIVFLHDDCKGPWFRGYFITKIKILL